MNSEPAILLALVMVQAAPHPTPFSNPTSILIANKTSTCDNPNGCRSLWQIVWNSLFTIFLCTWVTVHPNIPGPHERWLKVALRRLGIMLAVLFVPEVVCTWAARQRVLARHLANQYKCYGWTETHGFFAVMGGYMAFDGDREIQTVLPTELEGYSLTGKGNIPTPTEEEIQDKSKANIISKGLVVLQVGWFVLQCIARVAEDLPVTGLEIVTIAFAVISLAMFVLWWQKPLDVERAIRVYKKPRTDEPSGNDYTAERESPRLTPTVSFRVRFCSLAKALFMFPVTCFHYLLRKPLLTVVFSPITLIIQIATGQSHIVQDEKRIATFYPETFAVEEEKFTVLGGAVLATVFGAIHCVAWRAEFPSRTEQIIWRAASVAVTGLPFPFLLLVWLFVKRWPHFVYAVVLMCLLLVYAISRISLLVLPLLSLRALSPDVYRSVDWVIHIPHL